MPFKVDQGHDAVNESDGSDEVEIHTDLLSEKNYVEEYLSEDEDG